jgi:hypothetical protein
MAQARWTVREIATRLGVDAGNARGLVKCMVDLDLAEHVGERRNENSRGASEMVFCFRDDYEETFASYLKVACLT